MCEGDLDGKLEVAANLFTRTPSVLAVYWCVLGGRRVLGCHYLHWGRSLPWAGGVAGLKA
jgi:hypothetical protein